MVKVNTRSMVRGDVVEVMYRIARSVVPQHADSSLSLVLTNDKTMNGRDRKGETLFIDACQLERWKPVYSRFSPMRILQNQETVQSEDYEGYEDVADSVSQRPWKKLRRMGLY